MLYEVITALSDKDSVELHEFDTVKGSDYLADQDVVALMCKEAPKTIRWAERMGAAFSRNEDGTIAQRPFGGQSSPRACFAKDRTGLTLLQTVYEQALREGVEFCRITSYNVCYTKLLRLKLKGLVQYNTRIIQAFEGNTQS